MITSAMSEGTMWIIGRIGPSGADSRYGLCVKVLLIAPTCDPDDVGEAWVAYQWASRLARQHDVTLLTYHKRGKRPASETLSGLRVVEWVEPMVIGRAERLNSMLKPAYVPFYVRARRWIRNALAAGERFDVAHQPVPVAMRYPTPVAGLGIPYIIGPIGGSLNSPPGFADQDTAPWYVNLRALDRARLRHDRLLRRTYELADCVVGIAPYVSDALADLRLRRFVVMSETGIDSVPQPIERPVRPGPVRLLFVGRLIRTKGARDVIQALGLLDCDAVVLDIVGDGFDRAACEALSDQLGLGDRVRFHGQQPRERVADFYRDADVFVFPSYREPGGNVAYEAMASGLPIITSDRGGPGEAVDESSGIRVHPGTPAQYARDLAEAIHRLVIDPDLRRRLGEGAYRRVGQIALWDRKIDAMTALYIEITA
jgi:glycosyltransferase involved in cell wall biosynthesis